MKEVSKTREEIREEILELESALNALPDPEDVDNRVTHHFAPGCYGREIFMKAGEAVVGKLHKHAHMNILIEGVCTVHTEFGREVIAAPHVWVSEPGTKRAVYNNTDVRWITIHPTDETDLDKIEDEVIAPTYDNLLEAL